MTDLAPLRRAKAASPAGCMRPWAERASTLAMLMALQMEPGLRGVKRIW